MDEFTFNLEEWRAILRPFKASLGKRQGSLIVGPSDLVCLEDLRAVVAGQHDLGPSVPTDVFVFALGEPKRRDVTKVGGAPYRPTDEPWPEWEDGSPMTFLCQYRFAESHDLVGDLPGEVLLVFVKDDTFHEDLRQETVRFEWYPLGIEQLIAKQSVPEPRWPWEFVECYGVRHRTVDYVDALSAEVFCRLVPKEATQPHPQVAAAEFSRVLGMKIGGLPVRNPFPERWPEEELRTRFLCSLASIGAMPDVAYPWVNQPWPVSFNTALEHEMHLDICDGFRMDISIDEKEQMHWCIDFG